MNTQYNEATLNTKAYLEKTLHKVNDMHAAFLGEENTKARKGHLTDMRREEKFANDIFDKWVSLNHASAMQADAASLFSLRKQIHDPILDARLDIIQREAEEEHLRKLQEENEETPLYLD